MFFLILKFWLSRLSGGWKGKEWPKMTKISICCTLFFRNYISCSLHLWCTCMYKMIISPGIFFIFSQNFDFRDHWEVGRGVKRAKNYPKWQKLLPVSLRVSGIVHDCDFWYTCVKWYLQQIFHFSKFWFFGFLRV